jgi:hypothetical protein
MQSQSSLYSGSIDSGRVQEAAASYLATEASLYCLQ